jgi:hypothetical protein
MAKHKIRFISYARPQGGGREMVIDVHGFDSAEEYHAFRHKMDEAGCYILGKETGYPGDLNDPKSPSSIFTSFVVELGEFDISADVDESAMPKAEIKSLWLRACCIDSLKIRRIVGRLGEEQVLRLVDYIVDGNDACDLALMLIETLGELPGKLEEVVAEGEALRKAMEEEGGAQ